MTLNERSEHPHDRRSDLRALFERSRGGPSPSAKRRVDWLVGILVFAVAFQLLHRAPNLQHGDSCYSMLLSENLFLHGNLWLDDYHLPAEDYRLERVEGHVYYAFPLGSSVLSAPLIGFLRHRGMSAISAEGSAFTLDGEAAIDKRLATMLMAAFAVLAYFTARALLPVAWSASVACVAVFGTQVFSTTSRAMWSDTWGSVLIGLAVFVLLSSSARATRPSASLLATLLSLAYVVRPTSVIPLVATSAYIIAIGERPRTRAVLAFGVTCAAWLGLFVAYSWCHFHALLPSYYAATRLSFHHPLESLAGNLVSPSRGLIIYVPALAAVLLLLVVHRRAIQHRALVVLAASVMVAHILMLAGFDHWWGGHSYGARLTASLVPWMVLLGVIAVDAARNGGQGGWKGRAMWSVVGCLCLLSIAMNAIGAYSHEAAEWNTKPNIDANPGRLWDWRQAQFLAPL
jgi:hypothetical protein